MLHIIVDWTKSGMLQDCIQCRSRQVKPSWQGLANGELGNDAEGLGVPFKTSKRRKQPVERSFANMAEGRMPQVVGKTSRLDDIGINRQTLDEPGLTLGTRKPLDKSTPNLCNLQRMSKSIVEKTCLANSCHLCDAGQAPERRRVEETVSIAFKWGPNLLPELFAPDSHRGRSAMRSISASHRLRN
jgi:hypothetical protein